MNERERLEQAYRSAQYLVELPQGELRLGIGRCDAEDAARIARECGCLERWALITPCNPRSKPLSLEKNISLYNKLRDELERHSQAWLKAVHRDPEDQWPDEPAFFLIDPDMAWVLRLGRRYQQNAIVAAELGQAPRLLWPQDR